MNNIKTLCYVKYWQDCNNKCSFCNQRLGTKVNNFGKFIKPSKESLITHTNLLLSILPIFEAKTLISLMGGELFHKTNMPELYEGFEYLATKLNTNIYTHIQYKIFTDLLFTDLTLLDFFIKTLHFNKHIGIKTSFDFDGRFKSDFQLDMFIKNLKWLCSRCDNLQIKTTITKQAIENFNPNSMLVKAFNSIVHLPNTWVIDLYKTNDTDSIDMNNKFEVPIDWKNSELFTYIYSKIKETSVNLKGSHRFENPLNNKIYFIMNNSIRQFQYKP